MIRTLSPETMETMLQAALLKSIVIVTLVSGKKVKLHKDIRYMHTEIDTYSLYP